MPTAGELEAALYELAPRELAQSWDNVGLLVGDPDQQVDSVLIALDITQAVVDEAAAKGCGGIVAHHPLMNCAWSPVQNVRMDRPQGKLITTLLRSGISAICMHTNLDAAEGGVNDLLADVLGIAREGRRAFADGCGRIGTVQPTTVEALARHCAGTLHSGVKYVASPRPVACLAEVSGAGGSYLQQAIDEGADCLVTGEGAHHIALLAQQKGVGLIVAGHWGTEHAVADVLAARLAAAFPQLAVRHAAADTDPYTYV